MGISAQEAVNQRKRDEWNDLLKSTIEDPQGSANHLVFGLNKEQREKARGNYKNGVPTWI